MYCDAWFYGYIAIADNTKRWNKLFILSDQTERTFWEYVDNQKILSRFSGSQNSVWNRLKPFGPTAWIFFNLKMWTTYEESFVGYDDGVVQNVRFATSEEITPFTSFELKNKSYFSDKFDLSSLMTSCYLQHYETSKERSLNTLNKGENGSSDSKWTLIQSGRFYPVYRNKYSPQEYYLLTKKIEVENYRLKFFSLEIGQENKNRIKQVLDQKSPNTLDKESCLCSPIFGQYKLVGYMTQEGQFLHRSNCFLLNEFNCVRVDEEDNIYLGCDEEAITDFCNMWNFTHGIWYYYS
jgi:hypothetical protein